MQREMRKKDRCNMPPKVKFQKAEIAQAALRVARAKGIEAVTAREVAVELGVSTRPIFTYYETMDQLRRDVFALAKVQYQAYIERGLTEPIPFQGAGRAYIRFAKEEPELYKLLFLTRSGGAPHAPLRAARCLSRALLRP